ncbi:MAG: hypothetical protein ACRD3G_20720 [Vicinamibacterales bacterium]
MDPFLESLQQSAFARFVGESGSLLGYPTVLFLHTLGLGTVAGVNGAVALRVLGFGRSVPIGPLDRLFPIMWFGFIVSALSGLALLVTDPVTRLHQTVFYVKLIFVALAVVNMQMMRSRIFRSPTASDGVLPSNARTLAMASLVLWIGATTAGRLIAYI